MREGVTLGGMLLVKFDAKYHSFTADARFSMFFLLFIFGNLQCYTTVSSKRK